MVWVEILGPWKRLAGSQEGIIEEVYLHGTLFRDPFWVPAPTCVLACWLGSRYEPDANKGNHKKLSVGFIPRFPVENQQA